ncbi:2-oxoglutarate:acceptor oxidoreductase, gamma subunit [Campylobacter insulaenigrae]|uniref:2-oxoglutarate:acceptor oxidoreductase, gamma subunit n=1 Tax=Campylobacter insulaenigrae NCTC 12927 TaxID=1031564 RepID=A0A0A8H256_9BACT|nr:2-oxoglutarate:acceptor oxidoreductase, gamma subunit [Campylobacter insulaenigrae]AJC87760.1 2-oxoglutarate:acceptor oxidoreductase, gamma subunit [Campylobacter insulaenigrae NCTC 12927]MCR6591801.1 2-oxoglutarate:acceptor oxidoreductase, gamma subunit [Campylobacter insulaenigrae]MCR6593342.1 2-oxoglutarate:acceptor oxidoreductase, gamma subunit [Campylobacter insulaenigrae]MCR6594869.1 2-oxoglutarate:acceptor oxidoreductase, gamma subunit [Campylobacter insulaenigrae]VEH94058.1 2-oxoglu
MKYQLRFCGEGGQGVITAGEILAKAAIKEGRNAFKASTYTSQVRGGPTKVDIIIDDNEIFFPYAVEGEVSFMLSTADKGYQSFKEGVSNGGIMVIEPNLVHPSKEDYARWKIFEIPIITIAKEKVGNVATQSVVALAIAAYMSKCIDIQALKTIMLDMVPSKTRDANAKAFDLGLEYASNTQANS